MSDRRLSICIPTYNRSAFLREAIASIIGQAAGAPAGTVEIVVSDNASTDDTAAVVGALANESPLPIRYFRNEANVGFDGNCLKAVERAAGRYCWLLGDDDLLADGALSVVLDALAARPADLYLGEKDDFYLTPDRPLKERRIMRLDRPTLFDFRDRRVIAGYFRQNNKLIAFFNFISIMVFRREAWLAVKDPERFVGSGYIHVYMFMSLLWDGQGGTLLYLPDKLVKRRWGEDRIVNVETRLKQDVTVFHRIVGAVLPDRFYLNEIDRLVIKNDGFSWAVRAKTGTGLRFYTGIFPFLLKLFWRQPLFWLKIFPLLFTPATLIKLLRWGYRVTVKGESLGWREIW